MLSVSFLSLTNLSWFHRDDFTPGLVLNKSSRGTRLRWRLYLQLMKLVLPSIVWETSNLLSTSIYSGGGIILNSALEPGYTKDSLDFQAVICIFLLCFFYIAIVVNLVYTYSTRIQSEWEQKPLEIRRSGGAIYLPYLVLHHTACSAKQGMSTF